MSTLPTPPPRGGKDPADHGLVVKLNGRGEWHLDDGQANAALARPTEGAPEIEVCGHCHARRSQLSEDYVPGLPLSDSHWVQLLSEGCYHPDGQILDEVYVYGWFLQSRMPAAGVTWSDCHHPHSLKLRAVGNAVCATCHVSTSYDTPELHQHPAVGSGFHSFTSGSSAGRG